METMERAPVEPPPGTAVCWDCHGTRRITNPYHHDCDRPLCGDPQTVECDTCDGRGFVEA
ncbi:hypothetical protein [Streptomyces sp. NPDC059783]|uniref:hypothetical protein n=1 Tax=Streptomyces sp. NPDC059783 TaxID=3346944 RepID=UPI0036465744